MPHLTALSCYTSPRIYLDLFIPSPPLSFPSPFPLIPSPFPQPLFLFPLIHLSFPPQALRLQLRFEGEVVSALEQHYKLHEAEIPARNHVCV